MRQLEEGRAFDRIKQVEMATIKLGGGRQRRQPIPVLLLLLMMGGHESKGGGQICLPKNMTA
jgi:hypothetical protein